MPTHPKPADARRFVLEELLIVKAIPLPGDRVAILCHYQPAAAEGGYITQVLSVDADDQWRDMGRFKWHGVDIAVSSGDRLIVVGRDGQIGSIAGGIQAETQLEESRALGPMRGIQTFGGLNIAFGMNRNVYVEREQGTWSRFENGLGANDDEDIDFDALLGQLGGINAVVQVTSGQLVAVGMSGEIWRSSSTVSGWAREESGTSLALHNVVRLADGSLVASGQAGVVLANHGVGWTAVDYAGPNRFGFISAAALANTTYLADGHSLRKLVDGSMDLVDVGTPEIMPCARLASGHGLIVGCAPKELYVSRDGIRWTLLL